MNTAVIKRSVVINDKKTSVSLEDEFWYGLPEIAAFKKNGRACAGGADRQAPQHRQSIFHNSHIRVQLLSESCQKSKT
jgi:predicted DNA-binding ribbon-helix-helix protein